MEKHGMVILFFLNLVTWTYGIEVESVYPEGIYKIKEGEEITLECVPDKWFYNCDFINQNQTFNYSVDPEAYNDHKKVWVIF